MQKIEHMTPDITQENIERLSELFPSVVTEVADPDGKPQKAIDFDALRELLGDVTRGNASATNSPGLASARPSRWRALPATRQ